MLIIKGFGAILAQNIRLDDLRTVQIILSDKGKPRESVGRKGAGPRQTDLGWVMVRDAKADLHKIAALPKSEIW